MMIVSAEIRLFWQGGCPPQLTEWFAAQPLPVGGGELRVDRYIRQKSEEISLKMRGGSSGHPSAPLRSPDEASRQAMVEGLVSDPRQAASLANT
ncbi:MAG TPA: hypothetical protein VEK34_10245 [Methylocella sp.]|nr:hypothetical protein [Methylocella sp.]